MGIFTECAKCDELKAEIERLQTGERAADAEIERLRAEAERRSRVEDERSQRAVEMEKEIERLREELTRIKDQIVKYNISIQEAIRRGEAFEWKTLTLDS